PGGTAGAFDTCAIRPPCPAGRVVRLAPYVAFVTFSVALLAQPGRHLRRRPRVREGPHPRRVGLPRLRPLSHRPFTRPAYPAGRAPPAACRPYLAEYAGGTPQVLPGSG